MKNYSWPGNIRELENIIHRSVLLSSGTEILPSDLYLECNKTESHDYQKTKDSINYHFNSPVAKAEVISAAINALQNQLKELYSDTNKEITFHQIFKEEIFLLSLKFLS